MDSPEIATERREGTALIILDRPDRRNTVTYRMLDALIDAFEQAERDDTVRAIVLTGHGSFFSAGTDISGRLGGLSTDRPLQGRERDVGGLLALRIFESRKPVIAAVNGTAVGIGLTMILPADIRICAASARFAKRGIVPESCSTWFLPRIVGIARAVELAITGRTVPADEALKLGLVSEVCPDEDVLERACTLARDIAASTSPVSVALIRQMLWRQLGSPHPVEANGLETAALRALVGGPDAREGIASFLERRPPAFASRLGSDLPGWFPWWSEPPYTSPDRADARPRDAL